MRSNLESKSLHQIIFPGAHDAGMGEIKNPCVLVPDRPMNLRLYKVWNFLRRRWLFKIIGNIFAKRIVKLAKAQNHDIDAQLKAGCRYFDLRLLRQQNGEIDLTHMAVGESMDEVLKAVVSFLEDNPDEIIILEERQREGFDQKSYQAYLEKVKERLGDKLTPQDFSPTTTYGDLLKTSHRIIYILPDTHQTDPPVNPLEVNDKHFWKNYQIRSYWPNAQTVDQIRDKCGKRFAEWGRGGKESLNKLRSMQIFFSPTDKQYVLSALLGKTLELEERPLEKSLPSLLPSWGKDCTRLNGMNILMFDFWVDNKALLQQVVELNLKKTGG